MATVDDDGAAERRRAFDHAAHALAARDRTIAEMRAFLQRKRIEPATIDTTIAELTASGLLDDSSYAARFVLDKREGKRWGRERIERDLLRRGILPELIERSLAGVEVDDELTTARALLRERFGAPLDGDRERDRAWKLLVRRGYSAELAYDAVRAHEREATEHAA